MEHKKPRELQPTLSVPADTERTQQVSYFYEANTFPQDYDLPFQNSIFIQSNASACLDVRFITSSAQNLLEDSFLLFLSCTDFQGWSVHKNSRSCFLSTDFSPSPPSLPLPFSLGIHFAFLPPPVLLSILTVLETQRWLSPRHNEAVSPSYNICPVSPTLLCILK